MRLACSFPPAEMVEEELYWDQETQRYYKLDEETQEFYTDDETRAADAAAAEEEAENCQSSNEDGPESEPPNEDAGRKDPSEHSGSKSGSVAGSAANSSLQEDAAFEVGQEEGRGRNIIQQETHVETAEQRRTDGERVDQTDADTGSADKEKTDGENAAEEKGGQEGANGEKVEKEKAAQGFLSSARSSESAFVNAPLASEGRYLSSVRGSFEQREEDGLGGSSRGDLKLPTFEKRTSSRASSLAPEDSRGSKQLSRSEDLFDRERESRDREELEKLRKELAALKAQSLAKALGLEGDAEREELMQQRDELSLKLQRLEEESAEMEEAIEAAAEEKEFALQKLEEERLLREDLKLKTDLALIEKELRILELEKQLEEQERREQQTAKLLQTGAQQQVQLLLKNRAHEFEATQREKLEAEAQVAALARRLQDQRDLVSDLQASGQEDKELISAFDAHQAEQQRLLQELLTAYQQQQERLRDVSRERTIYREAFFRLTRVFKENAFEQRTAEEEWRASSQQKDKLIQRLQRQAVPVWQRVFALRADSEDARRIAGDAVDGEKEEEEEEDKAEVEERRSLWVSQLRFQLLIERNAREALEQETWLLRNCLSIHTANSAQSKLRNPLILDGSCFSCLILLDFLFAVYGQRMMDDAFLNPGTSLKNRGFARWWAGAVFALSDCTDVLARWRRLAASATEDSLNEEGEDVGETLQGQDIVEDSEQNKREEKDDACGERREGAESAVSVPWEALSVLRIALDKLISASKAATLSSSTRLDELHAVTALLKEKCSKVADLSGSATRPLLLEIAAFAFRVRAVAVRGVLAGAVALAQRDEERKGGKKQEGAREGGTLTPSSCMFTWRKLHDGAKDLLKSLPGASEFGLTEASRLGMNDAERGRRRWLEAMLPRGGEGTQELWLSLTQEVEVFVGWVENEEELSDSAAKQVSERLYPTLRGSSVQTLAEELQKLTAKVGEMGVQSMMRNATSFAWQSLVKGLGEDQEERQESLQKALHQQQRLNEQLQLVQARLEEETARCQALESEVAFLKPKAQRCQDLEGDIDACIRRQEKLSELTASLRMRGAAAESEMHSLRQEKRDAAVRLQEYQRKLEALKRISASAHAGGGNQEEVEALRSIVWQMQLLRQDEQLRSSTAASVLGSKSDAAFFEKVRLCQRQQFLITEEAESLHRQSASRTSKQHSRRDPTFEGEAIVHSFREFEKASLLHAFHIPLWDPAKSAEENQAAFDEYQTKQTALSAQATEIRRQLTKFISSRLHSGGSAHSFGEYSCLATSKMLREYSSLSDLEFNEILSGKACQTTQPQPAMRLHLDGMPPWLNLRDMFFPDKGADKRSSSGAHSDKGGIREEILSMKLMVTGDQLNMLFKHVTAT